MGEGAPFTHATPSPVRAPTGVPTSPRQGRALCPCWPLHPPLVSPAGMLEYEPAKRFSIQQIRQHR